LGVNLLVMSTHFGLFANAKWDWILSNLKNAVYNYFDPKERDAPTVIIGVKVTSTLIL
jgi:hypothetical protein